MKSGLSGVLIEEQHVKITGPHSSFVSERFKQASKHDR